MCHIDCFYDTPKPKEIPNIIVKNFSPNEFIQGIHVVLIMLLYPPSWPNILWYPIILQYLPRQVGTVWKMWYQVLSLSLSQFTPYLRWYLEASSKRIYQSSFVCVCVTLAFKMPIFCPDIWLIFCLNIDLSRS